jgi:2-polyprenyl-6-hydroxyphenyl methylase/3-demethylubiquinone-9 3-methyltransferase
MNASTPATAAIPATSIDPAEAAHFGKLAADWWNPKGSSAMLHRLNPVRLRYLRDRVDAHWGGDGASFRPLAGKRALDVGCGAGLLAEPLARLGAAVTAIDAAPENIAVARAHVEGQGLSIDYRAVGVETLDERFDLVTCVEVIEHVADPAAFVANLVRVLAPGGLLILSTPNRTQMSRLAMIGVAEGLGRIPRGTHDWNKFLTPDETTALLGQAGLHVTDVSGIAFSPLKGLILSDDKSLNYIMAAVRA